MLNAVLYSVGVVAAFLLGLGLGRIGERRACEDEFGELVRLLEQTTAETEQVYQAKAVLN